MKKVKFLHCGDIHLDAPFASPGGDRGFSSLRRQDLKNTFTKITNIAAHEAVDLLLISGDLYEHSYIGRSTFMFLKDRFSKIPKIKVIIIPGNHDPYVANSCYATFRWPDNVYILTRERPYVFFEDICTYVYGTGFSAFTGGERSYSHIKAVDPMAINILLFHGTIDMNVGGEKYNPASSDILCTLGMDYIAAGHFHNRIDDIGKKGIIYNPGSPEPLGFDETGPHGVYLGTVQKDGPSSGRLEIRFIETNEKYYESIDIYLDEFDTDESAAEKIIQTAGLQDSQKRLLLVTLKGYIQPGFSMDPVRIKSLLEGRYFNIRIKDETMPAYRIEEVAKEAGIKGLFARKMAFLMENEEDEHRKKLLMDAFFYGMEALEQGRVNIALPEEPDA